MTSLAKSIPANAIPAKQRQITDFLLVLLTVALFYLAFPGSGIPALAWFAIVPVLIALDKSRGRYAFMLGLLAATLGWMSSIWWAVTGIAQISAIPVNLVIPVIFIYCLWSALPYALVTWLHSRFHWGRSLSGAIKSAAALTVLINYIPQLLPGNLAHALYLRPLQIQLADIGGVPLVFFVVHCVNFLLAAGLLLWRSQKVKSLRCFALAAVIFLGNLAYGTVKSETVAEQTSRADTALTVAMIQPNLDISLRTREAWLQHRQGMQDLIIEAEKQQPLDLMVIPEVPVPVSYKNYPEDQSFFHDVKGEADLLLTAIQPLEHKPDSGAGYFNTMELISGDRVSHQYFKQKLLPLGEYLPFEQQLPFLRDWFPGAANYQSGREFQLLPLALERGEGNLNILPLICYEAVFSDFVGAGVELGGNLLVNTVNDAWFGQSPGGKVHLALSLFRAVEYRLPLVRATNTGITAIVDPGGSIIPESQIAPYQAGFSVTEVKTVEIGSFYRDYPNVFKYICMLFLGYALITGMRKENA
ncbi:apolipoprotein N-acyltransferase [Thalassomonas viridans]|uniref:Apolipoprotein N-acyltransferase n=1 Tax=Thalassomonas viridans TaxID=137584 RepID=A0AAE9Z1K4_9GAMM|nr:apolipoprotein N-acyltransferase [Thalassomonas viridans]WDE05126.1 apolipoprotein N-acyltransferase [Thalassomonas viridans]